MPIKEEKRTIRQRIIDQRNQIFLSDRQRKSQLITERIINLSAFEKAGQIMVYLSYKSEVITEELICRALKIGKGIVVPVVDLNKHQLTLSEFKDGDELLPASYGIKEPKVIRFIHPDQVDLFLLPGVAFDERGIRLGYGGGYFDRLLSKKRPEQKVVGVAYELQIQEQLPYTSYDIPMDMVITEEKVRVFN